MASDKSKTKESNLYFKITYMGRVHNKAQYQSDKKEQKLYIQKFRLNFEAFKMIVIKTNRSQQKALLRFKITYVFRKTIWPVIFHFPMQKEHNRTTNRQQTKIQIELAGERCWNRKAMFCPWKYVRFRLLQTSINLYVTSH